MLTPVAGETHSEETNVRVRVDAICEKAVTIYYLPGGFNTRRKEKHGMKALSGAAPVSRESTIIARRHHTAIIPGHSIENHHHLPPPSGPDQKTSNPFHQHSPTGPSLPTASPRTQLINLPHPRDHLQVPARRSQTPSRTTPRPAKEKSSFQPRRRRLLGTGSGAKPRQARGKGERGIQSRPERLFATWRAPGSRTW